MLCYILATVPGQLAIRDMSTRNLVHEVFLGDMGDNDSQEGKLPVEDDGEVRLCTGANDGQGKAETDKKPAKKVLKEENKL